VGVCDVIEDETYRAGTGHCVVEAASRPALAGCNRTQSSSRLLESAPVHTVVPRRRRL